MTEARHATDALSRPRLSRPGPAAALLLAALTIALHHEVAFEGRSLLLSNHMNPLDYRPMVENYGEGMVPPSEWQKKNLQPKGNTADPGSGWWQWEPAMEFLRGAMASGEFPFWDPYIGGGTPALANLTPAFLFPPFVVMVALGGTLFLKNAYMLLLVWQAALFTFLFLRSHGIAFAAALGGGAAVVLSGAVNQTLGTHMGQTLACLPICLWATRLFLDAPTGRRTAGLAAIYAMTALASFPPILIGVFGMTATYAVAAIALGPGLDRRFALGARWAATAALSAGLVSFYYLPVLALRASSTHTLEHYEDGGLAFVPALRVFQLLSPTLMGGVRLYASDPVGAFSSPHIPYAGAIVLLAVLLARPGTGPQRPLFYASLAAVVGMMLKLLGLAPMQWIAHLPLFNNIHFAFYLGYPLGIALALLASLGIDSVLRGRTTRRAIGCATLAVAGAAIALAYAAGRLQVFEAPAVWYWARDYALLLTVAVIGSAAVLTAYAAPRWRAVATGTILSLLAIEGLFNSSYPRPRAWDVFRNPPAYVQVLRTEAGPNRVLTFAALNANLNSPFGIFTWDSLMAFNAPRMFELYRTYAGSRDTLFLREARRLPPEPVLDRGNTTLVAIREAFPTLLREAESRGYDTRFSDGYVRIFGRAAPPRFWFSSDYRVVTAAGALEQAAVAPSRVLLLESPPGVASQPNSGDEPLVDVIAYRRNAVSVRVRAPRPGLVYAAETFTDGWSARRNGEPAPLHQANYAFRAVAVPEGDSVIDFSYWPPGLTAGLAGSGVSLLLLAVLVARPRRNRTTSR